MKRRRLLFVAASLAVFGAAVVAPVQADPAPPSELVAVTSVPLALTPGASTSFVTKLDENCSNALNNGQSYAVTASTSDSSTATISPAESPAVRCAVSKKNSLTEATFTVAVPAAICGPDAARSATLSFMPIAGPTGLQNKLDGPLEVTVNVTGIPTCTIGDPPPPDGTGNPAAPAVANAYLNSAEGTDLVAACKNRSNVTYTGNGWRGAVLSAVAAWMPKPHSVKNELTATEWTDYVRTEVNHICKYTAVADAPIPATPDGYDPLPAYAP